MRLRAGVSAPQDVVDWHVASRGYGGKRETGDAFAVVPRSGGVLVAVVDGLGHGVGAAEAGQAAASAVSEAADEPLSNVLAHADEALRETRGAALALAAIDTRVGALSWMSVGNVEGVLWAADEAGGSRRARIRQRSGLVGFRVPAIRPRTLPITPGDLLVVGTDGVDAGFARACPSGAPARIAEELLARFGKPSDDALLLAARYRGSAS